MKQGNSGIRLSIAALGLAAVVALPISKVNAQSTTLANSALGGSNSAILTAPTISAPTTTATLPNVAGPIKDFQVRGLVNISVEAVRANMQQKVGDTFNPNSAEADRQVIEGMGYFSAVTDDAVQNSNGTVSEIFTVIENPKVTQIVFTGNTIEPTPKLMGLIQTKIGQVLNTNKLSTDIENIISAYQTEGYRASISEDINLDPANGVLTIPIVEARVSSILITGNHKTQAFVITREMKTRVGDAYNEIQFRKDLTKVFNLGLFDNVGPADISTPEVGKVALVIPVKEHQTGTVSVSVGYSTQEHLVGRAQLSESNFRGRAETASISWEVAGVNGQSSFETAFGDPYIDKHHDGFNIDLYNRAVYRFSSSFINSATTGSTNEYYERHLGGSLALTHPVSDNITTSLNLRTESVNSNNVSLPIADSFIRQDANIHGVGIQGVMNTRDNDQNPAAGGYYSLAIEGVSSTESTVGNAPTPLAPGTHDFPKLAVDFRKYISLQGPRRKSITEPKRVLAFRLLGGFTSSQTPFSEQYFLGGADSLRGYQDDRFWGNNLVLLNSEVRIPIANSLTGVVFFDVGDAWGSIYQGLGLEQTTNFVAQSAVGLGVRVTTPIGPIRVDYGFGRDGGRTDFSIGQSF